MALNHGYSYRHVLGPEALGHTVLSYLVKHFSHSTAEEWQARVAAGELWLDDHPARGDQQLRPGSIIVWNRPGWIEEGAPLHFSLVYVDDQLLVVDKPSGLPTLPGAGFLQNTLLSLVQADFPQARPLHRLGRATSGLVLFALDATTASILSRNWPSVQKQYQALGSGVAVEDTYDIHVPIGPIAHPRLGDVHAASAAGKAAHSVARVLQRRADSTLFEVDLRTGRPHQIRIHLASIGHPLVGDPLYAAGGLPLPDHPGLPGDAGYHLHAKRVTLIHPVSQQRLELIAPLPEILCCG